jgi:hypothetical protein
MNFYTLAPFYVIVPVCLSFCHQILENGYTQLKITFVLSLSPLLISLKDGSIAKWTPPHPCESSTMQGSKLHSKCEYCEFFIHNIKACVVLQGQAIFFEKNIFKFYLHAFEGCRSN